MSNETKIEPSEKLAVPDVWPPNLTHAVDEDHGVVRAGDKAICGATLIGLDPPPAHWPLCPECWGL